MSKVLPLCPCDTFFSNECPVHELLRHQEYIEEVLEKLMTEVKNTKQKVSDAYRDNPFWNKTSSKVTETRMERGTLMFSGRTIRTQTIEEIIDVLKEVYESHYKPSHPSYNECDRVPCSLCCRIEEILNEINT